MKKPNIYAEIAGWLGAACIVLAYILVSFEAISASSAAYQLLNLGGAVGIMIIATVKHVTQSIVLNAFWGIIAIVALARMLL